MCGIFAYCNYLQEKVCFSLDQIQALGDFDDGSYRRIAKLFVKSFATASPVRNTVVTTRRALVSMVTIRAKFSTSRRLERLQVCARKSPTQPSTHQRPSCPRSLSLTLGGPLMDLPPPLTATLSALIPIPSFSSSITAS